MFLPVSNKLFFLLPGLLGAIALSAARADASIQSLDLPLDGPDITSNVTVAWQVTRQEGNVVTGKLMVTGKAMHMDIDDLPPAADFKIYPTAALGPPGGDFEIIVHARVDLTPNEEAIEATSGTLRVDGFLGDWRTFPPQIVPGGGNLLSGDIAEFGIVEQQSAGAGIFEFVFTPTGGDLTAPHPHLDDVTFFPGLIGGNVVSTNLHDMDGNPFALTLSSFTADFSNNPYSTSDIQTVVPEPPTFPILLGVLLIVMWTGRVLSWPPFARCSSGRPSRQHSSYR